MSSPDRNFLLKNLLRGVYWFDEGLQSSLEAAGWPRMSRTKSVILINIADGITRPSQIAANVGLSRQAVHLALQELVGVGLVILAPDPADRRATIVRYSNDDDGARMRRAALTSLHRIESALEARLGGALFRQLKKALERDWGAPVVARTHPAPTRRDGRTPDRRGPATRRPARVRASRRVER